MRPSNRSPPTAAGAAVRWGGARKPLVATADDCQTPAMTYGIEQYPAL
ncbi:hypothetical protein [Streptomyces sp. NPDC002690]